MKKVIVGLAVLLSLGLVASQGLAWDSGYGTSPAVFPQQIEGEV